MTKTKSQKARAKGKNGNGNGKTSRALMSVPRNRGLNGRGDVDAYYRMLKDPCAAPLVRAPYTGIGSSYLVRTVNTISVQTAQATSFDYVLEFTPWNAPTALTQGAGPSGSALTLVAGSISNFVTNGLVVKSFRPAAACLKWVPNGPISSRQGTVGLAYSPSKIYSTGAGSVVATDLLSQTMRQDANGSVAHEITWLPSFGDERFGSFNDSNISGAGSIQLVLSQVDGYNDTASTARLYGYVELTVVWEWEPLVSGAGNVVPSVSPPTRFDLRQVLSGITDVAGFLMGDSMQGLGRIAYQYARGSTTSRGPGMQQPRLTY